MIEHFYYRPKYRPPSFDTLPAAWELVERGQHFDPPGRRDLPMGNTYYGIIRYQRRLTPDEVEQYELVEL